MNILNRCSYRLSVHVIDTKVIEFALNLDWSKSINMKEKKYCTKTENQNKYCTKTRNHNKHCTKTGNQNKHHIKTVIQNKQLWNNWEEITLIKDDKKRQRWVISDQKWP
jgi:hypothetical protein